MLENLNQYMPVNTYFAKTKDNLNISIKKIISDIEQNKFNPESLNFIDFEELTKEHDVVYNILRMIDADFKIKLYSILEDNKIIGLQDARTITLLQNLINKLKLEDELNQCLNTLQDTIDNSQTIVPKNNDEVIQFMQKTLDPMMKVLPNIFNIINNYGINDEISSIDNTVIESFYVDNSTNNCDNNNFSLQDSRQCGIIENKELLQDNLQSTENTQKFMDSNLTNFVGAVNSLRDTIVSSGLSSTNMPTTNVTSLFLKILRKLVDVASIYGIYIKETSNQMKQIQKELDDLNYITSKIESTLTTYKAFLENQEKKMYAHNKQYQTYIVPELSWSDTVPYKSDALIYEEPKISGLPSPTYGSGMTYAKLYALNKSGYIDEQVLISPNNFKWQTIIDLSKEAGDSNFVLDVLPVNDTNEYSGNSFVKVGPHPGDTRTEKPTLAMISHKDFNAHLNKLIPKLNALLNMNYSTSTFEIMGVIPSVMSSNNTVINKILNLVNDQITALVKEMQKVSSFLDGIFNIVEKGIAKNNGSN